MRKGFIDVEECRIKSVNRGLFKGFGSGAGGRGGGGQGTGEREIERLREYVEEGENMEFVNGEWPRKESRNGEWYREAREVEDRVLDTGEWNRGTLR